MKRLLSLLLIVLLVATSLPVNVFQKEAKASGDSAPYTQLKAFRITVDGEVYQADGYLGKNDELYFTPSVIKQLLGARPSATVKINGVIYTDLKSACNELGMSSFEYDKTMNAAYIWTTLDNRFSDENRLKFYNLGTPTNQIITYKDFFAATDKVIEIADPTKLNIWKNKFIDKDKVNAHDSTRTMTRLEGMMAILNLATMLGSSYNEFNTNWSAIDEMIGTKVWDEIGTISDPYHFIPNHYPYGLNGFLKDSYVYDWDDCGVAYRYAFGRSSLLNGKTLFDYDKALNSMRPADFMTVSEALNALSRFLDSHKIDNKYISLTDSEALNYNTDYITDRLLTKAKGMPEVSDANPPKWYGFVLPDGSYERTDIDELQIDKNFKRISDWGFNSVRYMLTYQTLFDDGVTQVNETNLKKLDAVIASAIKYNLHLNIVTFSLPGRWTRTDFKTYTSTGSLDLFTNPTRQQEANAVWALIAKRYKDIPSSVLSFCPLWEAQNTSLSSGLYVPPYTVNDVAVVYNRLIKTIRDYDPDRYIIYEPTPNNEAQSIINESNGIKNKIENNFKDTLMISNFCENPYVYAEMTAIQGEHIDHNNHSMFKPEYPVTYYATQYHINNSEPLTLQGDLVQGTKIDLYLSKISGSGTLNITTKDGTTLYSEALSDTSYTVDTPLSRYFLYAKSNKCISVTLPQNISELKISYSGSWYEWSGIDVTLPQQYAVNRWWFMSFYDATKQGIDWQKPSLKPTSRIMLSPNSYNSGRVITINSDITYNTSSIWAQSNEQTIYDWGAAMSQFSPNLLVRFECAAFNIGTEYYSALRYYDDFMAMCKEYHFSWLSNDFNNIFSYSSSSNYAGGDRVPYQDGYLLVDMLKTHQKYLPSPTVVNSTGEKEDMNYCTMDFDKPSYSYSGDTIIPQVSVKNGLVPLVLGEDYTLIYSDNINVGTGKVTVSGKGNYSGTVTKTFQINAKPVTELTVSLAQTTYTYTGLGNTPSATVMQGAKTLKKDSDYTLVYMDNTYAGTGKVIVTGKGNYSGTVTKTFQINAKPVTELSVSLAQTAYTYTGLGNTPSVTVMQGAKTLKKEIDYTLVYKDNTNIGTGKIIITGKGNYVGAITKTFQIKAKPITELTISPTQTSYNYTGASIIPVITVKYGSKTLVKNTDYTLIYMNNTKVGTAKITITGKGNYSGTVSKTFRINPKPVSTLKMSLSTTTYVYTEARFTPAVTVMDGTKKLVKNTDYTVTYSNNLNIGSATVTLQGKGNYTGTLKKPFQIVPGTSKLKLTAGSKKATISWSKVKGASGYEVYMSTSKTGKYTLIKTTGTLSYVKSQLTRGKGYYFKVIAYTNVQGKKVYGSYTPVGTVKIK